MIERTTVEFVERNRDAFLSLGQCHHRLKHPSRLRMSSVGEQSIALLVLGILDGQGSLIDGPDRCFGTAHDCSGLILFPAASIPRIPFPLSGAVAEIRPVLLDKSGGVAEVGMRMRVHEALALRCPAAHDCPPRRAVNGSSTW
jgi:hypothetical protein